MKKEVILVPRDKCPLDALAEMGERTKLCWIFLHGDAVRKLVTSADSVTRSEDRLYLHWYGTSAAPSTSLEVEREGTWRKVFTISASDIAFNKTPEDPEEILFLEEGK